MAFLTYNKKYKTKEISMNMTCVIASNFCFLGFKGRKDCTKIVIKTP